MLDLEAAFCFLGIEIADCPREDGWIASGEDIAGFGCQVLCLECGQAWRPADHWRETWAAKDVVADLMPPGRDAFGCDVESGVQRVHITYRTGVVEIEFFAGQPLVKKPGSPSVGACRFGFDPCLYSASGTVRGEHRGQHRQVGWLIAQSEPKMPRQAVLWPVNGRVMFDRPAILSDRPADAGTDG